jgi:hypothetical protein
MKKEDPSKLSSKHLFGAGKGFSFKSVKLVLVGKDTEAPKKPSKTKSKKAK